MKAIILWCRERIELKELEREIQEIWLSHSASLNAVSSNRGRENELLRSIYGELAHLYYEQNEILTSRRIRAARSYGIPIPQISDDSEYWSSHSGYSGYFLTLNGHAYLRREIAFERDLFWKPIITWAALTISIIGLLLSLYNFFAS